ncbi:GNAT family N-acetyltransferase [Roseomonas sp. BN140053]|uniref:bifunctional acetate--CoA ligase family protein/GNAT family N-acetyltransferase n=1 Tax=Roseomonas sp. BN140053 TaxID=3391898 RepID=UPI0039EA06C3
MVNIPPSRHRPGFRAASLFAPRRVALLADPALPEAAILARNLLAGGFQGALHAVGAPWEGLAHAATVEVLDAPPDLAVVALPPADQLAAFAALAAQGCRAVVVPVASPDLAAEAKRAGLRALGQRSFGLAIPALGLNATLSHIAPRPGRLALLCQSAAVARVVLDWAAEQGVGFSLICGIGSNADYGFAGALDWLARDTRTGAVLLELRRIKNRRQFISAARATASTRPVVALRAGGRTGIADGLGAPGADTPFAGDGGVSDAVMAAVLRRAGVLRVSGLGELLSAAETLARIRPATLRGRTEADRIAVVANALGPGLLAADAALAGGGQLAVIPAAARLMLDLALPEGWHGSNPLVLPPGQGHRLAETAAMLATLPEVGAVVAIHAPAPEEDGDTAAAAMAALVGTVRPLAGSAAAAAPDGAEPGTAAAGSAAVPAGRAAGSSRRAPVLVGWLGQFTAAPQRHALAEAGAAVFATPEAAVRGALHLAQDQRNREAAAELPPRDVLDLSPDRAAVRRLLDVARAENRRSLNEAEALDVLDAYGLPTVPRRVVRRPEEAGQAAMQLGFPVALKVLSPDLPGKTEVGGVVLNLRDVRGVRAAGRAMLDRLAASRPGVRIDGLLVQQQAPPAAELRLRLGEDAMFGPWIGFGAGGTAADLHADEAFDLPPLNRTLAQALINRTRLVRRLRGWRDHPAVALDALADALVRLSALAVDFPEIRDATINPLHADPSGVLALDADLRLRPPGEAALLAIPPYPAELAAPWTARDGRRVLIRPIRPEDAEAHAETFRALDPEDIRRRFFSPLRVLPPAQIARLTQIDYDREMAFIAAEARPGLPDRTVGVSRLVREGDGGQAEFAVLVTPPWKGQGLGRALMRHVLDWGRSVGVRRVTGQVLAENVPMQRFVTALGFTLRRLEDDLLEASLELETPAG